jgi:uncharacterized membrane protein
MPIVNASLMRWTNTKTERLSDEEIADNRPANLDHNLGRRAAVVTGWDVAAFAYLGSIWPIILRADSAQAEQLATREDETRRSATVLLLAASVASLLEVGGALSLAGRESGPATVTSPMSPSPSG